MNTASEPSTISDDPRVQAFYEEMRRAGQSHNIAEMLALRETPGAVTDREFWRGQHSGSQFADDPTTGKLYVEEARRAGVSTTGKIYQHGLARFPGDPKAWVSGRGDVKRRCIQENFNCEGMVKHKATIDRAPSIPLADDIVNDHVAMKVAEDPGLRGKEETLAAEIREKHTPHWHKRAGRTFCNEGDA